jgi:hypothetical protein
MADDENEVPRFQDLGAGWIPAAGNSAQLAHSVWSSKKQGSGGGDADASVVHSYCLQTSSARQR